MTGEGDFYKKGIRVSFGCVGWGGGEFGWGFGLDEIRISKTLSDKEYPRI